MRRLHLTLITIGMLAAALFVAVGAGGSSASLTADATKTASVERVDGGPHGAYVVAKGIHKIKHVIIIMQENRSFDSYFGTYPGADGIPMKNGRPAVCVPNPDAGCTRPYHDTADVNGGGPHSHLNAELDIDGGRMDGFIRQRDLAKNTCQNIDDPACVNSGPADVMGYHTGAEIPNYWTYAKDFSLDDHMYEPATAWSLVDHLYLVSGWAARCKTRAAKSCHNTLYGPAKPAHISRAEDNMYRTGAAGVHFSWTDITYLLHRYHVSWSFFVQKGTQPDCDDSGAETCTAVAQNSKTPGIWNPLPLFTDVHSDRQLQDIRGLSDYYRQARDGRLPAVSWITPSNPDSEHPPASVHQGQAYVTSLINAAMKSPDWNSTAIFLSWDDWGGFYDGIEPPAVDQNGYGLRVPSITISPYARQGFIDHQTLSHDAYLKFIEDDFLDGARLNPKTDGRWDPRPDVREDEPLLGNLVGDFNFSQKPRPPVLLPTNPPTDSPSIPAYFKDRGPCVGCTKPPPATTPASPGV